MLTKVTHVYVYFMFAVFLFFTGFEGYVNIFTSKCIVFTVASALYAAVCAVVELFFSDERKRLRIWHVLAFVYLVITAVSAFASDYFPKTLVGVSRYEGLVTMALYLVVFYFVSRHWRFGTHYVVLFSAVMILQSSIVVLQYLDFNVLWLFPNGVSYHEALKIYNGAFISTVGNADIASAFFSLMTPILIALFFYVKKLRPLTAAAAVLSLAASVLVSVTAGIVSLLVCAAVCVPVLIFPRHKGRAFAVLGALLAVCGVLLFFIPFESGLLGELHSILHGDLDRDFGSGRIHIWSEVLKNTGEHVWLGTGPDTMLYSDVEPFVKLSDTGKEIVRKVDIAHNDYLNVLFHQGIFAALTYIGLICSVLVPWFRNKNEAPLLAILGTGVFAYAIHIIFSFSACSSAVFFWIVLGMTASCITKKEC